MEKASYHSSISLGKRAKNKVRPGQIQILRTVFQHIDCLLPVFSLESGEFMATSSNKDISETENFFCIFDCVSEIYVKFGVF